MYKGERGTQYHGYQIQNHDVKVLFGDLNFRINMPKTETTKLVQSNNYQALMAKDELY